MTSQQVTVTAQIKVKPGTEEQFKQDILSVVALTRTEEGCINYDLHQAVDNPSLFILHESWASVEAFTKHLAMPYIEALDEEDNEDDVVSEEISIIVWQ